MTRHTKLAFIKRQLDPSHDELRRTGFLANHEYRTAATGHDWVITYWPGPKYLQDQQTFESRRALVARFLREPKPRPTPRPPASHATPGLLEEILQVCGDRQNTAAYLNVIREHPAERVRLALHETHQADLCGTIRTSRGAFFLDTLKRLRATASYVRP